MTTMTCVIRTVAGIPQYVPADATFNFRADEPLYTGVFKTEVVKDGPSGSHERTICLPQGELNFVLLTTDDVERLTREAYAKLKS